MSRSEVLEAEENFSEGQKGSSAMPHKRNPVLTENLTGLARLVRMAVIPALENIALPLYYQGISRAERQKTAIEYLEKVGLADWAEHLPSELSGGQKQRIAIARALASQPKVLLADEPTGALDSTTSEEVMDLIKQINREGKTILVVTHEQDIANMCKRIITLKDGIIMTDVKTK